VRGTGASANKPGEDRNTERDHWLMRKTAYGLRCSEKKKPGGITQPGFEESMLTMNAADTG
jgi:hypothetical protein